MRTRASAACNLVATLTGPDLVSFDACALTADCLVRASVTSRAMAGRRDSEDAKGKR